MPARASTKSASKTKATMRATATKNRGASRKNVRRRPSAETLARMEEAYGRHLKGEDPAPEAPTLPAGLMFDLEVTKQCAEVSVKTSAVDGDQYDVTAGLEISSGSAEEPWNWAFVALTLHRRVKNSLSEDRQTLELHAEELEPMIAALSRAVQLARQRGFLP